jgi:predicted transcriptional regulator YheO
MTGASQLQAALEPIRGRSKLKSTSIGIKDSTGIYIASGCGNVDLSFFDAFSSAISLFSTTNAAPPESFELGGSALRANIDTFAHERGTTPRMLTPSQRREPVANPRESGHLEVRRSMPMLAGHLGISRATAYSYARQVTPAPVDRRTVSDGPLRETGDRSNSSHQLR